MNAKKDLTFTPAGLLLASGRFEVSVQPNMIHALTRQLPTELCISIFADWIEILDVAILDSAICSKYYRKFVLDLFFDFKLRFRHCNIIPHHRKNFVSWVVLRDLKIESIEINNSHDFKLDEFKLFIRNNCSAVSLSFTYSDKLLHATQKCGNKTKGLRFECSDNFHDDDLFSQILQNSPKITSLNLTYCILTDNNIVDILSFCPEILEFNFQFVRDLSFDMLQILIESYPNMIKLNLRGVKCVNDDVLIQIANNCQFLTHLDVSQCGSISDFGINFVSDKLDSIIEFNWGY
jgi:hypothetical protein